MQINFLSLFATSHHFCVPLCNFPPLCLDKSSMVMWMARDIKDYKRWSWSSQNGTKSKCGQYVLTDNKTQIPKSCTLYNTQNLYRVPNNPDDIYVTTLYLPSCQLMHCCCQLEQRRRSDHVFRCYTMSCPALSILLRRPLSFVFFLIHRWQLSKEPETLKS